MKKQLTALHIIIAAGLLTLTTIMLLQWYSRHTTIHDLKSMPQNVSAYLQPQQLQLKRPYQQQLYQQYLNQYFSAWDNRQTRPLTSLAKQSLLNSIKEHQQQTSWAENLLPHDAQWINNIIANINIETFPNANQKAITILPTDNKVLPTLEPSFNNVHEAGEGFPFDNLQNTYLPANTPIRIIHYSQDHAWAFALIPLGYGWIPIQNIALVNDHFIKTWRNHHYIVPTKDDVAILDNHHIYRFPSRIGMILPVIKTDRDQFTALIAIPNSQRKAMIEIAAIPSNIATPMPLLASQKNIASVANNMLGQLYGWGGYFGYRDCSLTLHDLYTPFGIWLTGDSKKQAQTGTLVALNQNNKQHQINNDAIAFFTVLGVPGHIMLYVGQYQGEAAIYHTPWGLRTYDLFIGQGRKIIGRTAITSLDLGKGSFNSSYRLLDKINQLTFIVPPDALEKST